MKDKYFLHESSYVDDKVTIGEGTKIWHFSHIHRGANIGDDCSLGQNVNVGSNVKIGNGVKIQNNVSVYEGVELEDYVFCGPSMVFTNDLTPRAKYPKGKAFYKPTLVKYGASIGANATIVCGNTIGKWAMIASGAVVTKDVVDYALMAGIPAKQIGWVCECGSVLKDIVCDAKKASFHQEVAELNRSTLITESIVGSETGYIFGCDDCNRKYKLDDNVLEQI